MQKPYNFVLSPILVQPSSDCTLVAPASKHPEGWLAREYTEIHTGDFLHLEDKSICPDGELCNDYARGVLFRRPAEAITPLIPIEKEAERRSQEGEGISV